MEIYGIEISPIFAIKFLLIYVLLVILPLWKLTYTAIPIMIKIGYSLIMLLVTFFAVKNGGAKRGFISK